MLSSNKQMWNIYNNKLAIHFLESFPSYISRHRSWLQVAFIIVKTFFMVLAIDLITNFTDCMWDEVSHRATLQDHKRHYKNCLESMIGNCMINPCLHGKEQASFKSSTRKRMRSKLVSKSLLVTLLVTAHVMSNVICSHCALLISMPCQSLSTLLHY
jgi:hypothetical protein